MSWNKDMSYMFAGCEKLEDINLSSFETSLVRDMSHMFEQCSSLKKLDVTSFDTSVVNNMDYMFSYIGVKTLNLASFNTLNVKKFDGVFEGCQDLNITVKKNKCDNLISNLPNYVYYHELT